MKNDSFTKIIHIKTHDIDLTFYFSKLFMNQFENPLKSIQIRYKLIGMMNHLMNSQLSTFILIISHPHFKTFL